MRMATMRATGAALRVMGGPISRRFPQRRAPLLLAIVDGGPRPAGLRLSQTQRFFASDAPKDGANAQHGSAPRESGRDEGDPDSPSTSSTASRRPSDSASSSSSPSSSHTSAPIDDWEENPNFNIEAFSELPYANFGVNQHVSIDSEFKEVLRLIPWQFRGPVRYAFAYGSGVFPQSKSGSHTATEAEFKAVHPKAPACVQRVQGGGPKMIDFIFGVSHTQHFHSLNLAQNRDHYSALGSLGSGAVSWVQDGWGAGVYFNPYVVINGILVKYGVVNINTLYKDLSEWDTLYLAGRLHKPVKILRDDARVRLANQMNLLSALRTALLLLPPTFTEGELYSTIAGISYLGDPRMSFPTENPRKVANIVGNNMPNFRRLYAPLIETLPNADFADAKGAAADWLADPTADLRLQQDMDPVKRGNMVRRLPKAFRSRLYFQYQKKFAIPRRDFDKMMEENKNEDATSFKRQQGGGFERRIAQDEPEELRSRLRQTIKQTISWPSTTQTLKGPVTSGVRRTIRYLGEKWAKWREGKKQPAGDEEKKSS